MRRVFALIVVLYLLALPGAAFAQSSAFGPLPPAQQATPPPPAPTPTSSEQSSVSRPLLLGIAGGVALLFVGIGLYIARDARRNLTEADRHALERKKENTTVRRTDAQRAKQKARARAKAQRQARKKQRPTR